MQATGWFVFVWHTVMPCTVFIVAYWRIFSTVRRQRNVHPAVELSRSRVAENKGRTDAAVDGQSGPSSDNLTKISRTELNILSTVVLMVLLQLICWLPSKIYVILRSFKVCYYR